MGTEIERKFLIKTDAWKKNAQYLEYRQGYIFAEEKGIVRVRIFNQRGFITIKSTSNGFKRLEYEYEIPLKDAETMLKYMCENYIIEKKRYTIKYGNHKWEIDEFTGHNQGLVIAEIELSEEKEYFEKPEWLGKEVSLDPKYYNSNLSKRPFNQWKV